MHTISHLQTEVATSLIPILPTRREPVSEEQVALQIKLLRRRQLRRADVQEKLRHVPSGGRRRRD